MIWLVQDAHQRGFRSGYTECRLIKKWVYAVYLRIPSTTPLAVSTSMPNKVVGEERSTLTMIVKHFGCTASAFGRLVPPTQSIPY